MVRNRGVLGALTRPGQCSGGMINNRQLSGRPWRPLWAAPVFWGGVFLAVSLVVAVGALSATSGDETQTGVHAAVSGTAVRPFVYRQLCPLLIRGAAALVPPGARRSFENWLVADARLSWFEYVTHFHYHWWRPEHMLEIVLAFIINLAALMIFAFAYRSLLRSVVAAPPLFVNLLAAVVIYGLVFFNREGVYFYDYPNLALFMLCLLGLFKQRWVLYYAAFALGCLNKETMVLATMVFLIWQWPRLRRRALLGHAAAQLAIYAAIKLILHAVYAANPGRVMINTFFNHNIRMLLNPRDEFGCLTIVLLLFALAAHAWPAKPVFLRVALLVAVPIFGLTLFGGWLDEIRVYYEVYPVIMALAALSFARLVFGMQFTAAETSAGQG